MWYTDGDRGVTMAKKTPSPAQRANQARFKAMVQAKKGPIGRAAAKGKSKKG